MKERRFEPYNLEGDGPMKALCWWDAEAELCELHKHRAVIFESYKKSRALGEHYHRLGHELSPLWRRQRDTLLEKAERHDKGTQELEDEMTALNRKIHRRMTDQRGRLMGTLGRFAASAAEPSVISSLTPWAEGFVPYPGPGTEATSY